MRLTWLSFDVPGNRVAFVLRPLGRSRDYRVREPRLGEGRKEGFSRPSFDGTFPPEVVNASAKALEQT
ncbi:hypothetical protein AMELA_G00252980 [Ameiurus melas]|uniref:Uncharacterized protein n=1 Tax=Ameiurus melas TaxID=219545 RepID=A0A7J5ZQJ0_AMEME|nr:hypothetical protein AMELA_G00252980 [Ameiurus melas]